MASNASILQFFEEYSHYPQVYCSEYQNVCNIRPIEDRLALLSGKVFDNEKRSYVDFHETDQNDRSETQSSNGTGKAC